MFADFQYYSSNFLFTRAKKWGHITKYQILKISVKCESGTKRISYQTVCLSARWIYWLPERVCYATRTTLSCSHRVRAERAKKESHGWWVILSQAGRVSPSVSLEFMTCRCKKLPAIFQCASRRRENAAAAAAEGKALKLLGWLKLTRQTARPRYT